MSMFVYQINKDRFEVFSSFSLVATPSQGARSLLAPFRLFFAFAINLLTSSRSLRLLSGPIRRFLILYSASFNLIKFFIISFTFFFVIKGY